MFFNREMSEKFGDFFLAHLVWMAFTMIENIPANPIDVRLLGADRVMSHPQMPANAIEQLGRGSHGDGGRHTADGVKIVVPWQAERLPYNSEYRESGSDYAGAPPRAPGSGGATSGATTCLGGLSGSFLVGVELMPGGGLIRRP